MTLLAFFFFLRPSRVENTNVSIGLWSAQPRVLPSVTLILSEMMYSTARYTFVHQRDMYATVEYNTVVDEEWTMTTLYMWPVKSDILRTFDQIPKSGKRLYDIEFVG